MCYDRARCRAHTDRGGECDGARRGAGAEERGGSCYGGFEIVVIKTKGTGWRNGSIYFFERAKKAYSFLRGSIYSGTKRYSEAEQANWHKADGCLLGRILIAKQPFELFRNFFRSN